MSTETLKNDLKQNMQDLGALNEVATPGDIVTHLKSTLWPMLEALVDEISEIDECVADIVDGAEDILQPETAAVFAAVIASSTTIAAALKLRITREADPQLYKVVEELEKNLKSATEILEDVVVDDGEGDGDGDDEDEDDDEEDSDDEDEDDDDKEDA